MRTIFIALSFFTFSLTGLHAQVNWPVVTSQSRPWTRWWWQGSAVDTSNLTRLMQLYKKAGLGGLEITPIYGVKGSEQAFINYLSPRWVDMLKHTLRAAKQLNLGIDMATGTGWPFGGPWVAEADACKYIAWKSYTLNGGDSLREPVGFMQEGFVRTANGKPIQLEQLSYPVSLNNNLQQLALDQVRYNTALPLRLLMAYGNKGESVDITDSVINGKLNWIAPAGEWRLYAVFEGLHGKMVERAAPGGEGNVIDHFSSQALSNYLSRFDASLPEKDIVALRGFFNDSYEVDDARGQSNWTPDFLREFKKRRGYSLEQELPFLLSADSGYKHKQVLYDYRNTVSELLLDNFTKPWRQWAAGKGKLVRNQSHGSPANILDLYAVIDIPETEGTHLTRFKFATSAAHVMGKPLASAEAATWLNDHFLSSLEDVKRNTDLYFTGGVNHIFYHGTNYSPINADWPGWLFYAAVHFTPANPFWKDFHVLNEYVANCQRFLQAGQSSSDVLLYFPFHDRNYEPARGGWLHHFDGMEGFEKTFFNQSADEMLAKGYSWDLISDRQIDLLSCERAGSIKAPGGIYQTILLSGVQYLPYSTLKQLTKLAKQGATILFHKSLPMHVPGWKDANNFQRPFDSLVQTFSFRQENTVVQKAYVGKGAILKSDSLEALLDHARIRNEKSLATKKISFVRRSVKNGEYYFLVNNGNQPVNEWVNLATNYTTAVIFNPMTKQAGLAKSKTGDGHTPAFLLQLAPGESCIIQTSRQSLKGAYYPYTRKAGEQIELSGTWKLKFLSGGPVLPTDTVIESLQSWTDLTLVNAERFSGTAQYSIQFARPAGTYEAILLNLGTVKHAAELFLNGKRIATLIGPDFSVTIPVSQVKALNTLTILITNGMANRMIDLDKRGVEWKKFYNINMPAKLAANRGSDGLFTTAGWTPLPSGLLGPVTIMPLSYLY